MTPLRDAVRFIDGDERGLSFGQHLRKAGHAQPLGSNKQKLKVALHVVDASLPRALTIAAGVDALGRQAKLLQLAYLVIHQGDERTDHQRGSTARQSRQLIAERLARSGGHDQQRIFSRGHRLAHRLLVGPEAGKAEDALQQLAEACVAGDCLSNGSFLGHRCLGLSGWRRRSSYRCGLAHPPHHRANVVADAFKKGIELRLTLLDPVEKGLPLARHRRTLHFRVHHFNQVYPFVGGLQALACSGDVATFQKHFDDGCPGRRGAEPGFLHGIG